MQLLKIIQNTGVRITLYFTYKYYRFRHDVSIIRAIVRSWYIRTHACMHLCNRGGRLINLSKGSRKGVVRWRASPHRKLEISLIAGTNREHTKGWRLKGLLLIKFTLKQDENLPLARYRIGRVNSWEGRNVTDV